MKVPAHVATIPARTASGNQMCSSRRTAVASTLWATRVYLVVVATLAVRAPGEEQLPL
jgi:hypothetical protein